MSDGSLLFLLHLVSKMRPAKDGGSRFGIVLNGKLLESETLQQQAASNTKEEFGTSPDLSHELLNAIMGALDAHTAMSTQALNSEEVRRGLKDILLNHSDPYETLRAQAGEC